MYTSERGTTERKEKKTKATTTLAHHNDTLLRTHTDGKHI